MEWERKSVFWILADFISKVKNMKVKGNGGTSVRKTQKYFYTKNDMKKKKNTA